VAKSEYKCSGVGRCRHACSVVGTRQLQRMDASQSSGASAPPAEERAAAGGNLVEGDPSVSSRTPQASVQAAQSIARGDSQLSEAESTGARDINVPEKETAAMRRDGEPLTYAAKRQFFECLILQVKGSLGLPRNTRTVVPLFTFYLKL